MLITKIELENQKIVAYQGLNFSNHPFPKLTDDVFPDTATKHAVLCSNAQFFPLAYMHPLLKKLIKTKHVEIHEVMVKIKTASRTVLILADDGTECENWPEHNISLLRITASGSRKQWYINLSGAELGLTQAFFTAADFESKHMQAQPGNDLSNLRKRSIAGSTSWTQPLVEALSQAVHGYISNYNVGGLMSQIINEPESLTREMMRRHFDYASILGDATTVEENANCPKVTLDLAKIEEQHKGPGVKDWPIHKKACKDAQNVNLEKKLARVAEVIQQAYYDFRENTWVQPVIKIHDRNDALVIYDESMSEKKKFFVDFPHHLVTNVRSKKALLCAWSCNEPTAWLHDTIVGLLEGLNIKVEEVLVTLGTVPRKIIFHDKLGKTDNLTWPFCDHKIIRVTATKTKKQWIMDLTGAQFGIYQTFWSWEEYANKFSTKTHDVDPIGDNKAMFEKLAKNPGNPGLEHRLMRMVADHLDEVVRGWKAESGLSLAALLDLNKETYEQASSKLLQTMDLAIRAHVKTHDYKAEFQAAQAYEREHQGEGYRVDL
ncbi:hypothetical protein J4E93_004008 [Alternaria ventricosa]|uniref:uncharacterized protein n=1 Tax=Alternaria ventricosa TaxID=1187951 RepID=UPI0020C1BA1E|nr:uncharacterized protein J4E93_004008 [Alternaria ventricosa]KAI4649688.1 hypothetical protein J4E93_004008 [Alternaria ventricosa]